MVLLNQRAYYEDASQSHGSAIESGTPKTSGFSHSLRSGNTNLGSLGEVSTIQFSEATESDIKDKKDDDIELGQISRGLKARV